MRQPMIYCVIPRELETELYDKMVDYYKDNPDVTVIVDRREGPDRRSERSGGGPREFTTDAWDTAVISLEALGEPVLRFTSGRHESAVFERDGLLMHVAVGGAHVQVTAAAASRERVDAELEALHELFPAPDPT